MKLDDDLRRARAALGLVTALVLAGCGHVPFFSNGFDAATAKFPDPNQYPITAEQIAAIPYASLGGQFQGQAKSVMILATTDEKTFNWVSANRITLTTQDEMIVATKGLSRDLLKTTWVKRDPLRAILPGQTIGADVYRVIDVQNEAKTDKNVEITSTYRNRGEVTINVLGSPRTAWLVEEKADFKSWRWSATNRFWIDPRTRQILRSRQQFTPELDPVTIEVLKPYG